jgi:hypothetical protein
MAPSKGYRTLNDNQPTEIQSISEVFQELIVKLGGKLKREIVDVKTLLKGVKIGERDNSCIRVAVYYRRKGRSQKQVYEKLLEWDQKNEEPLGPEIKAHKVESA